MNDIKLIVVLLVTELWIMVIWVKEGTHSVIRSKDVIEPGPHYEGDPVTVAFDKKHFTAQIIAVGKNKGDILCVCSLVPRPFRVGTRLVCVCVCMCVCARLCVCVCGCAWVCVQQGWIQDSMKGGSYTINARNF